MRSPRGLTPGVSWPQALYFAKALCDVMMAVNGYHLYKEVAGENVWLEMT